MEQQLSIRSSYFSFLCRFVNRRLCGTVTNVRDNFQFKQLFDDYFLPMSNILTSFSAIAKNEGISISALESKIGASKGVLSRALNKNTDIQVRWLVKLVENYPHYNPEWILTGKGAMLRHVNTKGLNELEEVAEEYKLQEKVSVLEEQIKILKDTNDALKETNDALKEMKGFLLKRIEELEGLD